MIPKYLDFLYKPAIKEYFIKFNGIYSRDHNGNAVTINFQKSKTESKSNTEIIYYCNKILIGETLESAIKRSLLDDFGLTLVDFDFLVFCMDTAKNKLGKSVARFPVITYVNYQKLKNNKVIGYRTTWLDRKNCFLSEYNPEARGWLKNNRTISFLGKNKTIKRKDVLSFVENLYQAGALDITIREQDQEPVESQKKLDPDSLEIRLPKDAKLRKSIFSVFNIGFNKKLPKKPKEIDTGQVRLRYYLN